MGETETVFNTSPQTGLTAAEVAERVAAGKVNGEQTVRTKSVADILRSNILTFFNFVFIVLAVLLAGFVPDGMDGIGNFGFLILIVFNTLVGIIQELRAKRTMDRLSLLSAPKALVIRDGEEKEIPLEEIVLDDITELAAGRQVCADGVVVEGSCEVNESLITGEPDAIVKNVGDKVMSGSFVVSGRARCRVEHIGADNFVMKISKGAKYFKKPTSEIWRSLMLIVKVMSIVIVPLGIALFCSKYFRDPSQLNDTVLTTIGSVIGMIPSGLVALASTVFCVSVIRLSRHKTIAQDLYCVETLARVDVLCLDKTGTITEGSMEVNDIIPRDGLSGEEMKAMLKAVVEGTGDENATAQALAAYLDGVQAIAETERAIPFSSARKWSGVRAGGDIAWQLAATCDDLACAIPVCAGGWRAYRGVNKYGDAPELKMDDERYRFIAGVESQSYAPYVKCPVLMLCSTNDEFFDADRAFDTFSRIASDCDKTFYFAARYNGHIGNTGLKDLELFIGKYLRGREVFIPAPAEIAIDEDADGELVARIRFDRNGEVRYCEVYMAEEMCESAMRDWVRCERKESAGEDEQVFRLNTVHGARRVFAYAKTKYSCGFAVSSKIAVKRLEKDYANSVERCRILYSSRNGRDSFTVARFDRGGTMADCFLQNSLPPVNLMEGPCGIEGIASEYGLKSFRINDPRYRPSENALLKFDVYAPETTTMQITVRAEKNGRDILYQCNLFLPGCESWTDHVLSAKDFKTDGNRPLAGLSGAKYISFCAEGRFCINNLLWL